VFKISGTVQFDHNGDKVSPVTEGVGKGKNFKGVEISSGAILFLLFNFFLFYLVFLVYN